MESLLSPLTLPGHKGRPPLAAMWGEFCGVPSYGKTDATVATAKPVLMPFSLTCRPNITIIINSSPARRAGQARRADPKPLASGQCLATMTRCRFCRQARKLMRRERQEGRGICRH